MTVDEFITKYNGKGVDFDGALNVPVFFLGFFACINGFFTSFKSTKTNGLIVNFNRGAPFTPNIIFSYTSYARGVISADTTVTKIGRILSNPKISRPIVERVKVYMVDIISSFSTSYQSMQIHDSVGSAFLEIWFTSIKRYVPFTTSVTKCLRKLVSNGIEFTDKLTMLTTNYNEFFHTYIISCATHKSKELIA